MEMQEKRTTPLGAIIVALFIIGCLYGAYYFFFKSKGEQPKIPFQSKNQNQPQATDHDIKNGIEIGIAYGTEKKRWLEWAVDQLKPVIEWSTSIRRKINAATGEHACDQP